MQRKLFYIFFLCAGLSFLPACKDYLEVIPPSVASEQAFWKNRQDALVGLNGCYNPLIEIFRGTSGGAHWSFSEIMADDAGERSNSNLLSIDELTFDAFNGEVESLWRLHYLGIARCNTLIDRIAGIKMEDDIKTRFINEARFLRGYYYFNLVRWFGDLPLVLNEVNGGNITLSERASVSRIYEQIISDLTAAEALPVAYPTADIGRVTRGAAKAMLAKVYLTQKNWPQAVAKAKEIIDANTYRLMPSYADLFTVQNRNSAEAIFEVQFARGGQVGTGNPIVSFFYQQFAPAGSGTAVTGVANSDGEGRMLPTNAFFDAHETNDPRRSTNVRTAYVRTLSGRPDTVKVNFTAKYLDPSATAGGGLSSGNGSENTWRVMRYADLLLLYAEALNEIGGGNAAAFDAVNQVRRRAKGTATDVLPDLQGLSQAELREAIYRERRVELAFEGHRWFDLVRTGRAAEALRSKNFQPRHLLLPVPQRERDLNANLTQNAGY